MSRFPLLSCLLAAALLTLCSLTARADDGIFPPAPAAASAINFDGRGFLIHGKRTFLASGGMEYPRVPRALWRDRLLRLKRAGFNCVEIYTFWNYHEPQKGQVDFTGEKDLNAFLQLVKELDLYAIVRVGPYVCAEWDSGGYPVWLRFEPGVRVREDNPQFEAAVDRYWDKLIPIVAANQINHGGAVVLVQLENEHPQGWGKEMPNAYFTHLRDKATALGLQVPYFFSGLHHSSDPAGDSPWSSQGRTNPWFSTEFWSVWYDHYGASPADLVYDRRFWKVLAYGGNGLNFYMLHGGTNFATWNSDEDASSYDYGAAIGQTGDLRPIYYRFKRAALFARSFERILEDSDNATEAYKSAATNAAVRVTARQSPSGTILFLDNNTGSAIKTQTRETDDSLFPASALTLAPGQISPIVHDFPLLPGVTLERSTPLLGIQTQGQTTTIVAYGAPGDAAEMRFHLTTPAAILSGGAALTRHGETLTFQSPLTASTTTAARFQVGTQTIRILAMDTATADKTWFVDSAVVVGPSYVGETSITASGSLRLLTESTDGAAAPGTVWDAGPEPITLRPRPVMMRLPEAPVLAHWQTLRADREAAPKFADKTWKASRDPLPMGADGDNGAYAWYRTTVTIPKAETYTLRSEAGGDWASVFLNGRHIASDTIKKGIALPLPAGTSSLAVLTAHYGRPKLFSYLGPIDTIERKGLAGPVILARGSRTGTPITTWRITHDASPGAAAPPTDTTGAGWADGTTGPEAFGGKQGYAWYVTTLPPVAGPLRRLHFENVDDNATVYLNGMQIASHEGWGQPFDVPLNKAWSEAGTNTLAVLVQNNDGGGGIQGAVTLETARAGDEIAVENWKMRGGVPLPAAGARWTPGSAGTADTAPAWFRATFAAAPPPESGPHPILRVTFAGLSHGFLWLNGHNLGRYPEKVPVDSLYLPEPWLRAGQNELWVFDEQGRSPAGVKIVTEQAASRVIVPLTTK